MSTQPNRGASRRTQRLNFRELLPVASLRWRSVPGPTPSDAIGVLWLDTDGNESCTRFAYLNRARAEALFVELHQLLRPGDHPAHQRLSAAERAQGMLRRVDHHGEASGA